MRRQSGQSLVMLLAASSLGACELVQHEPWTLPSGVLAFTSNRAGNADIYVRYGLGGELVNLTRHDSQDHWASWSPDGLKVVFQTTRDGNREIYVMNADGSDAVNLTNHPAQDLLPAFSPDGKEIAFFSTRGHDVDDRGPYVGAIYVMRANGSQPHRITNGVLQTTVAPAWSPDGRSIAFSRDGNIRILSLDGTREEQITVDSAYQAAPSFSPDGVRVAFYESGPDTSRVIVMNLDGTGRIELTRGPMDFYPTWSPDGAYITYTSLRGDNYEIVSVSLDASTMERFTNHPSDDRRSAWAPGTYTRR